MHNKTHGREITYFRERRCACHTKISTMTENAKGWAYSHKNNCYVATKKTIQYTPRFHKKQSSSDAKSITIKVKSEALTSVKNL